MVFRGLGCRAYQRGGGYDPGRLKGWGLGIGWLGLGFGRDLGIRWRRVGGSGVGLENLRMIVSGFR